VSKWKIGQRVGVGLIAGEDGVCEPCRRGDTVSCEHPVLSGVTADGRYGEVMIAEARGIASVPEELSSAEAAPLLCAGVTTDNALSRSGAGARREKRSKDLGAHVYIDGAVEDTRAVLQRMGGAKAILATGTSGSAMGALVSGLAARGKLIVVGAPMIQSNRVHSHSFSEGVRFTGVRPVRRVTVRTPLPSAYWRIFAR